MPPIRLATSHVGCARAVGAMWRLRLAVPLEGPQGLEQCFPFKDLGWWWCSHQSFYGLWQLVLCLVDVIKLDDPWRSINIHKLEIIGTYQDWDFIFSCCFINSMESARLGADFGLPYLEVLQDCLWETQGGGLHCWIFCLGAQFMCT